MPHRHDETSDDHARRDSPSRGVEPFRAPWEHSRRRIERRLALAEIVGFAVATVILAKLAMEGGSPVLASVAVLTGGVACVVSARLAVRCFSKRDELPRDDHGPEPRRDAPGDAFPMWILWTVGSIFLFGVGLLVTFGMVYGSQ